MTGMNVDTMASTAAEGALGANKGAGSSTTCCPPVKQASCCEPSEKASCCGAAATGTCGCQPGSSVSS
jgi:hypothetical protein